MIDHPRVTYMPSMHGPPILPSNGSMVHWYFLCFMMFVTSEMI